jgi:hypothetical protein
MLFDNSVRKESIEINDSSIYPTLLSGKALFEDSFQICFFIDSHKLL